MEELHVSPKKLEIKMLNNSDIIRAILFEKQRHKAVKKSKKEPGISAIANILAKQIETIYRKLNGNIIQKDKIKKKICEIFKLRQSLLKFPRAKRYDPSFSHKMEEYRQLMLLSFDVSRKRSTPKRRKTALHRKQDRIDDVQANDDEDVSVFSSEDGNETDLNYEPPGKKSSSQKKTDLTEIIETQSRYGASDRCTSAIVNATLRTFGIPAIIDKSKLSRAQKRKFSEVNQDTFSFGGGIYYDGRKDLSVIQTRKPVENGKFKFYRTIKREEHISIVSQPEGLFLGYVPIKKSTAKPVSESIISLLEDQKIFNKLMALGSDGTNLNVGADGGINHFIEMALGRPLHWFICMLHLNELPLKRLIEKLDGSTSGDKSFSGPVGKALADVSGSAIVKYKMFDTAEKLPEMPEPVFKKLSNDQKYLYKIVGSLISGQFPESLKQMKIGEINHSRWLTTASRICKLYALTEEPSSTLQTLTSYIVNVYAPSWFHIKKHELAVDGPKNLHFLIRRSNLIADEAVKQIVQERIQWNGFFAHSENVLLAQLSSKKKSERLDAVLKILKIREHFSHNEIRQFRVPQINFEAKKWTDMIEYDRHSTEPPFTVGMTDDELIEIMDHQLKVPKYKCHTQMVERAVKEVTRVSLKAVGHEKRNCMVKATLRHRAKYPKLDSVKDHIISNPKEKYLPKI